MRRSAWFVATGLLLVAHVPLAVASGPPSAPQDLQARDGWAGISVQLWWSPPADNGSFPIENYWIERATTGAYELVANVSEYQTSYRDGNVSAHTTYHYRVMAVNAYGPGAAAEVSWTTIGQPSAPQNVTATPILEGISVDWHAPAVGENYSSYVIYRVVDGELWWQASVPRGTLQWRDTAAAPDEPRTYRLAAENQYGPGELSEPATGSLRSPGAPQNLSAVDAWGTIGVSFGWHAPDDPGTAPIDNYTVERASGGAYEIIKTLPPRETWYTDGNLSPHTSYQYRVRAVSAHGAGEPAGFNWTTGDFAGAPQNASATGSRDGITLAWDPPLKPEGFSSYVVYRVVDEDLWWTARVAGHVTSWFDGSMAPGESRTYRVAAENQHGPGELTPPVEAARTTAPPSPPRNLTAGDTWGSVGVSLWWNSPADPGSAPVSNYTVERAIGGVFELLATLPAGQTWYNDRNVTEDTSYSYRVRAVSAHGASEPAEANRTTGHLAAAPVNVSAEGTPDGILLQWDAVEDNVTSYVVYRVVGGELWWMASVGADNRSFLDDAPARGETRSYRVAAENQYGPGHLSDVVNATRPDVPTAPRNLTATTHLLANVTLTWEAPASDGGSPLTSYRVWRAVGSGVMTLLATTPPHETEYADATCPIGQMCHYRVSAVNAVGDGPRSNEASGLGS